MSLEKIIERIITLLEDQEDAKIEYIIEGKTPDESKEKTA